MEATLHDKQTLLKSPPLVRISSFDEMKREKKKI